MANIFVRPKPLVLAVIDGVGVAPPGPGNAVSLAKTPNLDKLWPSFPHTYLHASGLNVGLPHGVDGNSEVGHMNLGAGKILFQELPRIDNAINNGTFFRNKLLIDAFNNSKKNKVHLMGVVGTGQVHASIGHLFALLDMAERLDINRDNLFIHVFTDGRDSPPKVASKVLEKLENELESRSIGRIASIIGRYYAMDRDDRWHRTKKAYDLLVHGKGVPVSGWQQALEMSYKKGVFDEYIDPYIVADSDNNPIAIVDEGDSVIFFNYRGDRAVQLTRAFEDPNFPGWKREPVKNLYFVGLSSYEKGFPNNAALPPEKVIEPIGKVISDNHLMQLRIAESEKFPHVTYFFNGRDQNQYPGEDRIEVPSPRDVSTYDQKPEMSANLLTDVLLAKLEEDTYDFVLINYANPDMVAHTGVLDAAVKAMETVDECIGRVARYVLHKKGVLIIVADHGNAEELINLQDGSIDTKHSTNPVPFICIQSGLQPRELSFGILADVAPTVLSIMGIQKPLEMTGRNLLV